MDFLAGLFTFAQWFNFQLYTFYNSSNGSPWQSLTPIDNTAKRGGWLITDFLPWSFAVLTLLSPDVESCNLQFSFLHL